MRLLRAQSRHDPDDHVVGPVAELVAYLGAYLRVLRRRDPDPVRNDDLAGASPREPADTFLAAQVLPLAGGEQHQGIGQEQGLDRRPGRQRRPTEVRSMSCAATTVRAPASSPRSPAEGQRRAVVVRDEHHVGPVRPRDCATAVEWCADRIGPTGQAPRPRTRRPGSRQRGARASRRQITRGRTTAGSKCRNISSSTVSAPPTKVEVEDQRKPHRRHRLHQSTGRAFHGQFGCPYRLLQAEAGFDRRPGGGAEPAGGGRVAAAAPGSERRTPPRPAPVPGIR